MWIRMKLYGQNAFQGHRQITLYVWHECSSSGTFFVLQVCPHFELWTYDCKQTFVTTLKAFYKPPVSRYAFIAPMKGRAKNCAKSHSLFHDCRYQPWHLDYRRIQGSYSWAAAQNCGEMRPRIGIDWCVCSPECEHWGWRSMNFHLVST